MKHPKETETRSSKNARLKGMLSLVLFQLPSNFCSLAEGGRSLQFGRLWSWGLLKKNSICEGPIFKKTFSDLRIRLLQMYGPPQDLQATSKLCSYPGSCPLVTYSVNFQLLRRGWRGWALQHSSSWWREDCWRRLQHNNDKQKLHMKESIHLCSGHRSRSPAWMGGRGFLSRASVLKTECKSLEGPPPKTKSRPVKAKLWH